MTDTAIVKENENNDFVKSVFNNPEIVFFDIECGTNFIPYVEMSVFAYVVTDENLNIKQKEQIYIKSRVCNRVRREGIKIDENKLKTAPSYHQVYDKIRDVLTRPNTIYVAHCAESDLSFLICQNKIKACKQYDLKAYDTIDMLKNYGWDSGLALESATKALGIEHDAHECLSDAKALVEMIRVLSNNEGVKPLDFLETYGKGVVRDSETIRKVCDNTAIHLRLKNVYECKKYTYDDMYGTVVCFSESFEKKFPVALCDIAEKIAKHGGRVTQSASDCNVFLHDNNFWSDRLVSAYIENKPELRVMSVTEFIMEHNNLYRGMEFDYELNNLDEFDNEERQRVMLRIENLKKSLETRIACHDHFHPGSDH